LAQFSVPTQADVIKRIEADFRTEAGVNPLRRSLEYGLLKALGGQSKGLYGFLANVLKLAFPDTAATTSSAYFWRWAAVLGIDPKAATPWIGVYRFTGLDTTIVPLGTELVRSDGWRYITTEAGAIGDVTTGLVDVAIEAQDDYEGVTGNNTDASPLALSSSIADVDSEGTVQDTTIDGTDEETAEEGLVRLLLRYRTPRRGGGKGDYEIWALEVAGATRAWESTTGPGDVTVAFVRDNDGSGAAILPDAGERTAVQEYVQDKAPLTVDVSVMTLSANLVTVTITDLEPDTSDVRDAIEAELADFFLREAEPGGTIRISRLREAISSAAGESSHTLSSPTADYTDAADEISIFDVLAVT
jgi:uncharacterized phage protein gp47/JayE